MKYNRINNKLFVKNRQNFLSKMKPNSVAFFNSNDIYPISADSTLPFEQHRDIFYLCGVDQEESLLILVTGAKKIVIINLSYYLKRLMTILLFGKDQNLTKTKHMKLVELKKFIG